jgi:hypothetical protein
MPSAVESMIAAQAIGKINEITPPEYSAAALEGGNSRFSYTRPEHKMYDGKSVIDSVVNDIKYGGRLSERYRLSGAAKHRSLGAEKRQDAGLYEALLFGYSMN